MATKKVGGEKTSSDDRKRKGSEQKAHTVLKGPLSKLGGFLLELFDGSLVNATALVDEMTSSRRFSGVDVSDDCDFVISNLFPRV